jgi:hypothetical protein
MTRQRCRLDERLRTLASTELGRHLLDDLDIRTVEEFRERVPLTSYADYESTLGQSGQDIPRLARVVSVADSFSAMVHNRPHRKGLGWTEAAEKLRSLAGSQLDPEMVDAFIRAIGHDQPVTRPEAAA